MAKQSKVMGAVTQTVRFSIDMLKNEIVENKNRINLNDEQLKILSHMIESSIMNSYNRTMDQILKEID